MVAMNVWPTDASSGSVANEARWRKMARHWAPSGVCAGVGGVLAPTLAGLNLTVKSGAAWVDGHFCELAADTVLAVTANGIAVIRFDPAANTAELLWRDAVTAPAQNPTGTWELPIAATTGSALTDLRVFATTVQAAPYAALVTAAWSNAAPGTIPLPSATRTIPMIGGQLYLVTSWCGVRYGVASAQASVTSSVAIDGVGAVTGQLLQAFESNHRFVLYGCSWFTPATSGNKVVTMNVTNALSSIQNGTVQTGWRIEPIQ